MGDLRKSNESDANPRVPKVIATAAAILSCRPGTTCAAQGPGGDGKPAAIQHLMILRTFGTCPDLDVQAPLTV